MLAPAFMILVTASLQDRFIQTRTNFAMLVAGPNSYPASCPSIWLKPSASKALATAFSFCSPHLASVDYVRLNP